MKKAFLGFASIVTVSTAGILFAQRSNKCVGEHNYCWPSGKEMKRSGDVWQYNNQSKSGLFAQGETTEINLIAYKGTEYMMNFCTSTEEVEGKIQFKIYDYVSKAVRTRKITKTEVPDPEDEMGERMIMVNDTTYATKYEKSKKLLYDNTKQETTQTYAFISEKTRKLLVEVFVPQGGGGGEEQMEASRYACVGMLILHQKGLTTGFQK